MNKTFAEFSRILTKIHELTQNNAHTLANIEICKCLGEPAKELLEQFVHFEHIIETQRGLDGDQYDARTLVYKKMMKLAEQEMTKAEFKRLQFHL